MPASTKSQRVFQEPCGCGACPWLPTDRPATKRESWEYVTHRWASTQTTEWCRVFAIDTYVWGYVRWVNLRRWRKPPEWTSGSVAGHELRGVDKPIFAPEAQAWVKRLLKEARERGRDTSESGG